MLTLIRNNKFILITTVIILIIETCSAYNNNHNDPVPKGCPTFTRRNPSSSFDLTPSSDNSNSSKVVLKIYYETLCPASVSFIDNTLRPVTELLGSYLDLHLIPYGHAKTRVVQDGFVFECQHGVPECFGNRLHACAIDIIGNMTQAVLYNACLMRYTQYKPDVDYTKGLIWCGRTMEIAGRDIWRCAHSHKGADLLNTYGEQTRLVNPSYVPYITINNSRFRRKESTYDLLDTLCNLISPAPEICVQRQQNRYRLRY